MSNPFERTSSACKAEEKRGPQFMASTALSSIISRALQADILKLPNPLSLSRASIWSPDVRAILVKRLDTGPKLNTKRSLIGY